MNRNDEWCIMASPLRLRAAEVEEGEKTKRGAFFIRGSFHVLAVGAVAFGNHQSVTANQ